MEKDLEIDLNITYAKDIIKNSISAIKTTSSKFIIFNKKMNSRIDFIIFQFKNIFNNNFYSGK